MIPAAKKIVIVEDEPAAADLFEEMLRINQYEVIKTHNGGNALSIIQNEMPDAVLLDIMMPDISGIEVLRFMRREPRLRRIPVVIVSAKALPSDIRAGMEAGATAYLTKPVGLDDLRQTVINVLQAAQAQETDPPAHNALEE
ncbi:MAG: response regulator [Chloroflexota bacterium]